MKLSHCTASANVAKTHVKSRKRSSSTDEGDSKAPPPPQKQTRSEALSQQLQQQRRHRDLKRCDQKSNQHMGRGSSSFHTAAHSPYQANEPPRSRAGTSTSRLHHPFKANFNDHFETSIGALRDVLPFVNELRQLLRPSTPEKLTLYDPYYCTGAIVRAWNELGVQHVVHENRDFYVDVARGTLPGTYDLLVTNPPFSDDHIWRLLDFLVTQKPLKPWAFVAPDYIASKPQYKTWVQKYFIPTATAPSPGPAGAVKGAVRRPPPPIPSIESILPPFLLPPDEEKTREEAEGRAPTGESMDRERDSSSSVHDTKFCSSSPSNASHVTATPVTPVGPEPFYIIPRVRYDYAHPLGVGHDHSHFKSMWFVWAGRHTNEVLRGVTVALSGRGRNAAPSRSMDTGAGGANAPVTVVNGYQALVEGHYVSATARRPNPARRQRAGHDANKNDGYGRGCVGTLRAGRGQQRK